MIALRVEFLTGRYVATAFNDRMRGEWPPHPARVFSALVAAWADHDSPCPEEQAALEWLECQAPPSIAASDAVQRSVLQVFVPVNDLTVLSDKKHREAEEAVNLLSESDVASQRAASKRAQARQAAIVKGFGSQQFKKDPAKQAVGMLPESRIRRARTFPTTVPESPVVEYHWMADAPATVQEPLARVARRVVSLGHSSSLVACRVVNAPELEPTWVPTAEGLMLRVTTAGQLERLEQVHQRARAEQPRVMPCAFQPYGKPEDRPGGVVAESIFARRWTVLRKIAGPRFPVQRVVEIATALRGGLLSHVGETEATLISGHGSNGGPSQEDHMAIVPLPFVGSEHADGSVLGVALCLPRAATGEQGSTVSVALARWEDDVRVEDEAHPALDVTMGRAGVLRLERMSWPADRRSLREETWCGPSALWASATPVALDKHPGDLWSRRPEVAAKAAAEAEDTIARACARIGLPLPAEVQVLPGPALVGAAKTRAYPRFPVETKRTRRALVHAWVRFDQPVRGPLLLGAGRYRGLGLMRPIHERPGSLS